jgi:hypothetical protein
LPFVHGIVKVSMQRLERLGVVSCSPGIEEASWLSAKVGT